MDQATKARDEWLALRCQSREANAFEALSAVMERPLLYYAIKLTGSQDLALDALQETWLRALRGIHKLKDPASIRPWLYSIVHAVTVDRVRSDKARERAEEAHTETFEEVADEPFSAADAAGVHQALDQLDPRHREVLVLRFLEDFSVDEIAKITGCPAGTVKSRLHYAKRAMRALLSGEIYEPRT